MKFWIVALLLVFIVAGVCLAEDRQKVTVEGGVVDQSGQPIAGATVKFSSPLGNAQATTNKEGRYSVILVCSETSKHTVTPSKAGYIFSPANTTWTKYNGGPSFTGRKQGGPEQKPGSNGGDYGRKR